MAINLCKGHSHIIDGKILEYCWRGCTQYDTYWELETKWRQKWNAQTKRNTSYYVAWLLSQKWFIYVANVRIHISELSLSQYPHKLFSTAATEPLQQRNVRVEAKKYSRWSKWNGSALLICKLIHFIFGLLLIYWAFDGDVIYIHHSSFYAWRIIGISPIEYIVYCVNWNKHTLHSDWIGWANRLIHSSAVSQLSNVISHRRYGLMLCVCVCMFVCVSVIDDGIVW